MSEFLTHVAAIGRKCFFDTNVFLYEVDKSSPEKSDIALRLVQQALLHNNGRISYQVVQEFLRVALTKFSKTMTRQEAIAYLRDILEPMLEVESSLSLFEEALEIHARYKLSWYDSLIVAAAIEAKCDVLYTEDLQHGQRFGELVVTNPFL